MATCSVAVSATGAAKFTLNPIWTIDPGMYIYAIGCNIAGVAYQGHTYPAAATLYANASVVQIGTAASGAVNGSLPTTLGTLTGANLQILGTKWQG